MIEINLLPEAYKIKNVKTEQNIPVNLILLSINAFLLAIFLIITAINVGKNITLHALNTRLKGLAPEQQKIIEIQKKTTDLKATNTLFSPMVENKFLWSKKLNLLSDLIIPGIWLRQISFENQSTQEVGQAVAVVGAQDVSLKIEATAVSVINDEMGIISKFVKKLKQNKDFISDFKGIELEGVLRRQIATVEVMDFTLICIFKQEVGL